MRDTVTTDVVVSGGGLGPRGRVTVLRLEWERADPLAVRLLVTARPDHPALPRGSWVVLRDFLRYGLDEPTGDGEVRLHPDPGGRTVRLELANGSRPCVLVVPRSTLAGFLDDTEAVLPAGEERSEDALDALIARLLES